MRLLRNPALTRRWSAGGRIATLVASAIERKLAALVNPWFWSWIALVVVFALGETVTGGLYVLPWAFGAGVAAILDALDLPLSWQWISFLAVSFVLTVIARRYLVGRGE
jgi:succinate dehydrogenase/fumarate reductase cytochrome b subunit